MDISLRRTNLMLCPTTSGLNEVDKTQAVNDNFLPQLGTAVHFDQKLVWIVPTRNAEETYHANEPVL